MSEADVVGYLAEPEPTQLKGYELPTPELGGFLTEIIHANICGSELHIRQGGYPASGRVSSDMRRCTRYRPRRRGSNQHR
ncbi:hypothetical protein [Haloarcula nitratireducens]|uniref:Alcohol dehydrogenase n=1 Tax=Haloarcula nitratireducens TaxID=2487749 RepID=A0AAW4PHP7_9EURY|nr:hypothetical protein [Halomicroarcula nitratireducens]MBX0297041.1 hypothetical protein [Halomicroarcula nitratireducens]